MRRTVIAMSAAALLLAGCAAAPPVATATPELEAQAALIESQAESIIESTFAELSAADAARDPELFTSRLAGDAAQVRSAEYLVAAQVAESPISELPSDMQGIYVSRSDSWPRMFAAVSEPPSDELTPVVYLWVQDAVQEPYRLVAWAHMIPGAVLPAMPGAVNGAEPLALGEDGVEPSPRKALEDYVEYLRQGPEGELAAAFGADSYAEQLFGARSALTTAAQGAGGAYVDTIQPDFAGTYALATSDGGALVFAPLQISSSFSVSDATLQLSARDLPLLEGSATDKVTYSYRDFVVLSVPPPGGEELPTVVAAEHHLVSIQPS
ncbi:hypothetical protein LGT39_14160 [Demequina sp. TTPB684]|uniref:hypothetical protein n=1 Tax=unclassified Demequina TaxID=2620311 RepID=UPI001CF10569|nr:MULTISPECIES: hypothetical protein [unclassified Demequina]MCB2413991.1 hypothetical protein [Demequina sp. TTPB684]UPU88657.1 hypothetical protein LGT36_001670 [Demequina sp. TMPB413]